MATHSRILAWRIPRTEESGGLQSMGSQKSGTQLSTSTSVQERTPGNFQINRGSETGDLALGHWDYDMWTKRKLMDSQTTGRIL